MKETGEKKGAPPGERAWFAWTVWLFATAGLLMYLAFSAWPKKDVFAALEVELPGLSLWTLTAAQFVRSPIGLAILAGAMILLAMPSVLGFRGVWAKRVYGTLALVTVMAIPVAVASVDLPIEKLRRELMAPDFDPSFGTDQDRQAAPR